jgi:polyhydroxybutyrate depolymerase
VVLAFHGGGSNAQQMVRFCGLNEKADEAGFIVVYPSGTGRLERALTWNAGNCCAYAVFNQVDDVGFVRALVDDLA